MAFDFSGRAICKNFINDDTPIRKRTTTKDVPYAFLNVVTKNYEKDQKQWVADAYITLMFWGEPYNKLIQYDVRENDIIHVDGFLKNHYDRASRQLRYMFTVTDFYFENGEQKSVPPEPKVMGNKDDKEYLGALPF